jgi:hypothetical protein
LRRVGTPSERRCGERKLGWWSYLVRVTNDPTTRFEIKLQPERRRQLDELASATGMSATDLCRLAIGQLFEQRLVREPLQ